MSRERSRDVSHTSPSESPARQSPYIRSAVMRVWVAASQFYTRSAASLLMWWESTVFSVWYFGTFCFDLAKSFNCSIFQIVENQFYNDNGHMFVLRHYYDYWKVTLFIDLFLIENIFKSFFFQLIIALFLCQNIKLWPTSSEHVKLHLIVLNVHL